MTIKRLKSFLKDNFPQVFKKTSMYHFKGSKIAIDVSGLAYSYWAPQQNKVINRMYNPLDEIDVVEIEHLWLQSIWSLLNKFLKVGITPVMIFDGIPPKEKEGVIQDRSNKKKISKNKIDEYRLKLLEIPPLLRTPSDNQKLKDLLRNYCLLSKDNYETLKIFFNGLGIPILQAKNEAEELCCSLCRESLVSAVYCEDVDCLAHLTPCWIYKKSDSRIYVPEIQEYMEEFEFILLDDVLNALNFTKDMFIDLCIMSGCDYNNNIEGLAVTNSYKKIKELKSIDNYALSTNAKDISILNHHTCRKLFAKRESTECCEQLNGKIMIDKNCIESYSNEYLYKCQMSHLLNELKQLYDKFPEDIKLIDYSLFENNKLKLLGLNINFSQLNI